MFDCVGYREPVEHLLEIGSAVGGIPVDAVEIETGPHVGSVFDDVFDVVASLAKKKLGEFVQCEYV